MLKAKTTCLLLLVLSACRSGTAPAGSRLRSGECFQKQQPDGSWRPAVATLADGGEIESGAPVIEAYFPEGRIRIIRCDLADKDVRPVVKKKTP